jgi:hypothetical protein
MSKPLALETERIHRGTAGGTWNGGSVTWDMESWDFIRRLCLLRTPRDMQNKVLETGRSLYSGRVGEPGGGFVLTRTLRDGWRRVLETERMFMGALRGDVERP